MTPVAFVAVGIIEAFITAIPHQIFLKEKNMQSIVVLIFLSLFCIHFCAGLIPALFFLVFFLIYLWWIKLISTKDKKWKKILFIITKIIVILYLILHSIHLPIRIYLQQTKLQIAINISVLFVTITCVAILFNYKKLHQQIDSTIAKENE